MLSLHLTQLGFMRVLTLPNGVEPRGETRTYEHVGCNVTTRGAKPYCSNHVAHAPYVLRLLAQLSAVELEFADVLRRGGSALDPEGLTCSEILRELRVHGPQTALRLGRTLGLDPHVLQTYLLRLARLSKLRLARSGRLGILVHPTDPGSRVVA